MSPEQRVEFDAYIRHTIAMGPRLAYKVNKLTADLKAREAEIAQLRGSVPGTPQPISSEPAPATNKTLAQRLDELSD